MKKSEFLENKKENLYRKNDIPLLSGIYPEKISWTPFVAIGLILSIVIAVAVNFIPGNAPAYVLAGILGLIVTILVLQNPELGAYILIISIFTNISDILSDKGLPSINRPLIALAMGSVLANYILRTGKFARFPNMTRTEWALLTFYAVIIASILVSPEKSKAVNTIIDITKDILVGICIFVTLNTQKSWEKGAWYLIITITILAGLGVIKVITGTSQTFFDLARLSNFGQVGSTGEVRYGGPIAESNLWGQVLLATIPLVLYRLVREVHQAKKILLGISLLLILLAMIYTESRGALVALAAITPLIALDMRIKPINMLIGILLFFGLLSILPARYTQRFATLNVFFKNEEYGLAEDESISGRRDVMLAGLAMFRDNPLLGVGFGNYSAYYWDYASRLGLESSFTLSEVDDGVRHPHSLYIEIISETGLLGLLAFVFFITTLFIELLRVRKKFQNFAFYADWSSWVTATIMSTLTFLISGMFLHGIFFRYIWMLIGLGMAAISISDNAKTFQLPANNRIA